MARRAKLRQGRAGGGGGGGNGAGGGGNSEPVNGGSVGCAGEGEGEDEDEGGRNGEASAVCRRESQTFAEASAAARSSGVILRRKSSRNRLLSPAARAIRCQRAACTGSALMPRPVAYISASRFCATGLPLRAAE